MNECLENISGCAHNCINTFGGFKCSCNQGYLLGKDLKSCIGKFMGGKNIFIHSGRFASSADEFRAKV